MGVAVRFIIGAFAMLGVATILGFWLAKSSTILPRPYPPMPPQRWRDIETRERTKHNGHQG